VAKRLAQNDPEANRIRMELMRAVASVPKQLGGVRSK
jgi:hypothetical protein